MVFNGDSAVTVKIFYLKLLLLVGAHIPLSAVNGQQVDVSLRLQGVTLPNNSLVDVDDILQFPQSFNTIPDNNNKYHDQALLCLTDLVDYCSFQKRGDWYYPNGTRVIFESVPAPGITFRRNRGAKEVINNRQFYRSVRLFRRGNPPERGRFRCELSNSANPCVDQILYVNILDIGEVTISVSGSSIAGRDSSLVCSASIVTQSDTPTPHFQWFFGPNNNSLPFQTPVTTKSGDTYTSILQFSPLSQSHAGMYTCRLGGNPRLAARTTITVIDITIMVTTNFNAPLMVGQTGNILTCDVSGADNLNPTITYQWTRNDGTTQTQVSNSRTLSLFPLRLTNAGDYTCNATVSSTLLASNILVSADNNQSVVMIQIPDLQSVTVISSLGTTIPSGSDVTVTCTVELSPTVMESELSLLMVDAKLSRDGAPLALSDPTVISRTFFYTTQLNSFGRNDSGNYTCTATVRPQPTSIFLTGMSRMFTATRITTGVYTSIQSRKISNNSYLLITDIGEGDSGALLCFTDLIECCHDRDTPAGLGALGQWFYPNGTLVGTNRDGQEFYVDRGPSVVQLNRRNNTTISGQFCCEVPDATSVIIRICVNVIALQREPVFTTTTCVSEVAVGVAATISVECLLTAPIIALALALYWKRRRTSVLEKNTCTCTHDGDGKREIYEEPDQLRAVITTTRPGNFELTKCPAYASTTNEVQPTQSGEYEYIANDSRVTSC